jgi:hypothetical protein
MDFAIFAIAFNIGKVCNKTKNTSKNHGKLTQDSKIMLIFVDITSFCRKYRKKKCNFKCEQTYNKMAA